MMKFLFLMLFSMGLFLFENKLNKMIIYFLMFFFMMFLNIYSTNLLIGGMNLFYMDLYSFYLILLSLWIIGCLMMMNLNNFMKFLIFLMMMILFLSFLTLNLLMFYLMFEMSLLPIFFMIMYGGYTLERFEAMMYMLMYTVISSMPFLWLMIKVFMNYKSLMMIFMMYKMIELNYFMYLIFILTFMIKMPIFLFHIWLPKAHVEAPVYGSMILAGILLKLGSYGVLRFSQILFIDVIKINYYLISLSMIGGLIISLVCLIQIDLKMLVAYSSIVHMGILMSGMMTLMKSGFLGGLLMMLAHGLCSSGLFYLVNLNYECMGSRLMYINKGSLSINSSLGLFWFLLCSSNLSAPVSLNLISELFLLISLICWNFKLMLILMLLCFFSAVYSLYLFSFSQHGVKNNLLMNYKIINMMDYFMLILHWLPLNIIFLGMNLFMYN
uniref:NADH dehydrogenase subunit 4 n=1 Tax=Polistes rothneyi TaxID=30208 RepID=UPI0020298913|nr:NADH dehydrogenase subunit 4 [Polistes rothneyi]UPT34489.1 NADH dehydrogenase subunit 4 [Polistes rothneyi]